MPVSNKKPASLVSPARAESDEASPPTRPVQCEHIRISGQRCGSPALRGEARCYFHNTVRNPYGGIPMPEDAASIQIGLNRVIRNLEAEPPSSKNYALMLYALQTASANLKHVREEAAIVAETIAESQKTKEPSLLELMKRELELEDPPEDCVE